jgi:hypothetical protein
VFAGVPSSTTPQRILEETKISDIWGRFQSPGRFREPPAAHLIELPTDKAAPLQVVGGTSAGKKHSLEDEEDDENEDDYPSGTLSRQARNAS